MTSNEKVLLQAGQRCVFNSFGDANSDKSFYVIRQQSRGRGIFSLVSSVLCHLDIADRLGLYPVVDFENFHTVYNEIESINGTANSWEYFFQPVSLHKLDDVYRSKRVLFSDNGYPTGYPMSITDEPNLYNVYDKYIKFRPEIVKAVERFLDRNFANQKVLGVHFRGQEMRIAPAHWFPPTKKQILTAAVSLLDEYGFSKLFAVSEEVTYIQFLKENFGDMIVATECYRTRNVNAYHQYPRPHHLYRLGCEIAVDALLLSKCHALLGCTSNVATFARFVNAGHFVVEKRIDNGPNSSNPLLAKCMCHKRQTPLQIRLLLRTRHPGRVRDRGFLNARRPQGSFDRLLYRLRCHRRLH